MRGEALLGFPKVAFSQPGARLEIGPVDLVDEGCFPPGDGRSIENGVPTLKPHQGASQACNAVGVRAAAFVIVVLWVLGRVNQLASAEHGRRWHPQLFLYVAKIVA